MERIGSVTALSFPRQNNLEWLRLLFAAQVVFEHVGEHLGLRVPTLLGYFPGVPAFFLVSGFLIYASYLNAPGWRYLENRFLRLMPGLVLVTLGGAAVALVAHGWRDLFEHAGTYAIWGVAQTTLGQAYNPQLFRDVGIGVINGSLWTLTTEILFYLFVPLLVWGERKFRHALPVLIALSFAIYAAGPALFDQPLYRDKTLFDAIQLTPLVWGWMFGVGILAVKHFETLRPWLKYAPWLLVPMAAMMASGSGPLFGASGNRLGLAYFACYAGIILWLAFATPYRKLSFDLSYGSYIWHLPVINLLLVLGTPDPLVAIVLTFAISAFSWFMVEKPALRLKHKSLKPVDGGVEAVAGHRVQP